MTRDEICQRLGWMTLPKTSEMLGKTQHSDLLDRIETIVRAAVLAEREACAEICDRIARRYGECPDVEPWAQGFKEGASVSAAKIRTRGQE